MKNPTRVGARTPLATSWLGRRGRRSGRYRRGWERVGVTEAANSSRRRKRLSRLLQLGFVDAREVRRGQSHHRSVKAAPLPWLHPNVRSALVEERDALLLELLHESRVPFFTDNVGKSNGAVGQHLILGEQHQRFAIQDATNEKHHASVGIVGRNRPNRGFLISQKHQKVK